MNRKYKKLYLEDEWPLSHNSHEMKYLGDIIENDTNILCYLTPAF